jgi:hypothetical protein
MENCVRLNGENNAESKKENKMRPNLKKRAESGPSFNKLSESSFMLFRALKLLPIRKPSFAQNFSLL